MTSPNAADRLSLPALLGALFFASYLAFQVGAAVSCFSADVGCLLTWTMYAGRNEDPLVTVVWRSGEETVYDKNKGVRGIGHILSSKVAWAPNLPPYLCEHLPDAEAIRMEFKRPPHQEVISCP